MMKHDCKFFVHPFTVAYIAIALFTGRFSFLFIHLFVALIHELCHICMAKILHIPIDQMTMLPFGFYAQMDHLDEFAWWKQILVVIAGPLSVFISLALLLFFYRIDFLSYYGYRHGVEAAYTICFFNLLPIYPLDGARFLHLWIHHIFDENRARKICLGSSILATIIFGCFCAMRGQWIILFFLALTQIKMCLQSSYQYQRFLSLRLIEPKRKKIKINHSLRLYRDYDNYYLFRGRLYDEKYIIQTCLRTHLQNIKKRKRKIKKEFSFFSIEKNRETT